MNELVELKSLISRIKQQEELTHEEKVRMFGLAWSNGMNGLLNPEDDDFNGAKEDWF